MVEDGCGILLVEDDPALALGLSDSLRFEGYRVVHTAKGEEAIKLAASESINCVILDVMLPDINGYQVCETIRERDPIVPILMLTARGQEADKIRGLERLCIEHAHGMSASALRRRVRARRRDLATELVIVDYVGLMPSPALLAEGYGAGRRVVTGG